MIDAVHFAAAWRRMQATYFSIAAKSFPFDGNLCFGLISLVLSCKIQDNISSNIYPDWLME